ncbi:nitrate regulatory gene2 protein [Durio zibethinus]|uniref:Nitrate regulatory gene2 protein n=1 Tax=Durio zibethinus TaxID=66656 RepID=A0A6P5WHS1_DURZI|nr:nitrate regulatory gene2 protein [Durio zibethinus]
MGCSQSKIENEEAVTRCKERKQFMKEAVAARNAFAAAHSAYAMSLKNTGAALSDYAHGEVQNANLPSHPGPLIVGPSLQPPSVDKLFPPPPPPGSIAGDPGVPIQRSASMPIQMPLNGKQRDTSTTTIAEDDEEDDDVEANSSLVKRRSRNYRGSGSGGRSRREVVEEAEEVEEMVTSTTVHARAMQSQPPQDSTYYYFFPTEDSVPGPSLGEVEEVRVENREVERKVFEERPRRVEEEVVDEKMREEEVVVERGQKASVEAEKTLASMAGVGKGSKKGGKVGVGSTGEKRPVRGSFNLLQVFTQLDDHFLKASESAYEVSKMLEATRLHYHSNFADNRGHIDHSARVMRVITWNRSFRGLKDNADNVKDDFDSEENETHATVLDKMLAWEKKLYDEVKASEHMKFEYQKKVATLNKLKKRGTNSEALEKAKAAVSHLHTRYIVDMQSMDSTVSEINRLRDEQLYPKLVQLVNGMATMWENMKVQHDSQSRIVTVLRDNLDLSQSPKETSDHHHERTIQLLAIVQDWHMQFCKLVDHQKEYIKALNCWLRLNLVPIESNLKEKVSSPPRAENPPIQWLLLAWQDKLENLPDEIARSAINNFAHVIDTIMQHQLDEMKMKEKCEESRKELLKKQRQFEDWYHKYTQRRTPEELDPVGTEDNPNNDPVAERKFMVDSVRKRLEEEEEAYQKLCIQVREKSLVSLKTRLPELFRAMTGIAVACSRMYGELRFISLSKIPSHGS